MDECVVTNENDISTRINPNTRRGDGVEEEIGIFFVLLNFVEKNVGHRSMCVSAARDGRYFNGRYRV